MAARQSSRRLSIDEQSSARRDSSTSSVHSVATPDTTSSRHRRRPLAPPLGPTDPSLIQHTSSSENPSLHVPDRIGPHDGPSRDNISTMRSSGGTNVLDGPITYTPTTHRISKAKKGKRVHSCEFPGCNKVFTRAEHRRRHELNHSPDASYSCPHAGCRKAFHRPDLLARHVERHDLDAQGENTYRHERTISDVTSDSGRSVTQPPMVHPTGAIPGGHRGSDSRLTVTSMVTPSMTTQSYAIQTPSIWAGGFTLAPAPAGYPDLMPHHLSDDHPTYSSPEGDGSLSPVSDTYAHYQPHGNSVSSIPIVDTYSYDPMMKPLPTAPPLALWAGIEPDMPQQPQLIPEFDEREPPSVDPSIQLSLANMDWDAWFSVWGQLSTIPGIVPSIHGMAITDALNCVNCYWRHFHPLFPILHRPSFSVTASSPLIAAAVIAIGSQYDTRANAKAFSIGILEACSKYLLELKPKPITSRSHVNDLQGLIMLEVLAKFRSRRADVEFSPHFKRLYESLAHDGHWISMSPLKALETLPDASDSEALEQAYKFWIGHETRRRILQSCYILELQQSVLFEHSAANFKRVRSLLFKGKDESQHELPMPCQSDLWEAESRDVWHQLVKEKSVPLSLPAATDQFLFPTLETHLDNDPFSTSLILAHILNHRSTCPDLYQNLSSYFHTVNSSNPSDSRIMNLFTYHSFLAAHHTPLRALLTVSGESWLFNQKLDREPDFLAAKEKLRSWILEDSDVKSAVWHSVQVLKLATGKHNDPSSSTSAPTEDTTTTTVNKLPLNTLPTAWCIYLSALVCWAYGFDHSATLQPHLPLSTHGSFSSASSSSASSTTSSTPSAVSSRLQMPSPISAQRDTDKYLATMDVAEAELYDGVEGSEKGRTRGLLEWVRRNVVKGEGGGLLNEAEGVLLRLVEGRSRLVCF